MGPVKTAAAIVGIYGLMAYLTAQSLSRIVKKAVREVVEEDARKRPRPIDF